MSTVAGVVPSWAVTGYKSGAATRRAILLALLAEEPRTIRGLAMTTGIDYANAYRHTKRMEASGLVRVDRSIGRHGAQVFLTEAGRTAARTL